MAARGGMFSAWVGNLPMGINEYDLRSLFERFGTVIDARLPRERKFGFVDFADESALFMAIQQMDGFVVHGCALRVSQAGAARGDGGGGRTRGGGGGGRSSHKMGAATPLEQLATVSDPAAMSEQILALPERTLWELVSHVKALFDQDAEQARAMLVANPALGLAILKAQIRLGMVTVQSISQVITRASTQQPAPSLHQMPAPPMHPPPPPPPMHHRPPPLSHPQVEDAAAADAMIAQLMQLTPQQLEALPPEQRAQVDALRQQYAGTR